MARNKKVRFQDHPDADDIDDFYRNEVVHKPKKEEPLMRPQVNYNRTVKHSIVEGQLVKFDKEGSLGTVCNVVGDLIFVLHSDGLITQVHFREVW